MSCARSSTPFAPPLLSLLLALSSFLARFALAQAPNLSQPSGNLASSSAMPAWNTSALDHNPGTNARIPTSISQSCQTFLAKLNMNSKVQACTAPLLNATSAFANGPQSVKADQVKASFDGLCHLDSGCEPGMVRIILNHMAGNCSSELMSGEKTVRTIYDVLYILTPYRVSICAQDPATKAYCPSVIASAIVSGTGSNQSAQSSKMMTAGDFGSMVSSVLSGDKLVTQLGGSALSPGVHRRDLSDPHHNSSGSTASPLYHPNQDTYTSTNLAFLFLNPDMPASALCSPCTQAVLAGYIGFEQANPYIGGLSSSGYLSGQVKLWQAAARQCGKNFVESINDDAGIMASLTDTNSGTSVTRFNIKDQNILLHALIVFGSARLLLA